MICQIVAIRDRLTGFAHPNLEYSLQSAQRSFADAIRENSKFGEHISDFSLYRLGTFDTDDGIVDVPDVPELICSGYDIVGGDSDAGKAE